MGLQRPESGLCGNGGWRAGRVGPPGGSSLSAKLPFQAEESLPRFTVLKDKSGEMCLTGPES